MNENKIRSLLTFDSPEEFLVGNDIGVEQIEDWSTTEREELTKEVTKKIAMIQEKLRSLRFGTLTVNGIRIAPNGYNTKELEWEISQWRAFAHDIK